MAEVLTSKATHKQVTDFYRTNEKIAAVKNVQNSFRLYKTNANTVNIEALSNFDVRQGDKIDRITYFKPIGFYNQELECYAINEFSDYVDSSIGQLNLAINAIAAGFSIEAFVKARERKDSYLNVNNLDIELILTTDMDIQIFLDDKYNLGSAIGTYSFQNNQLVGYSHTMALDKEYHLVEQMELMTLFKRI